MSTEHTPPAPIAEAASTPEAAEALVAKFNTPPAAAPTPTLPPEVADAVERLKVVADVTSAYHMIGQSERDSIRTVLAALPRPAQVTADAEALAERVLDIAHDNILPTEGGSISYDEAKPAIAAVLAPVLRERDELRAEVERLTIREANDVAAYSEAADKEIADLRAQLAAALADKVRLDTLRRLMGYTQDGSNQTVKLFEDDATRDFFVMAGRRTYMGGELRAAIDVARNFLPPTT